MTGLASLDREAVSSWFEDFFWRFNPEKLEISENLVQVETLDSLNLAPDVVKIDVQGLEQAVVEGGMETFRLHQPLTIVEAPTDGLVELFGAIGLKAYAYENGRLVPDWRDRRNVVFASDGMRARLNL